MGLAASPGRLDIATLSQLWQFRDALAGEPATGKYAGHDALDAPRQAWVTGDCDNHDIVLGPDGRPIFANPLFSASPPSRRTPASRRSGSRAAPAARRQRIADT